jgi:ribonuclease HII
MMTDRPSAPDNSLEAQHQGLVVGLDEAGRGPWAGPVVAAAVILDPKRPIDGLNDSKMLKAHQRQRLAAEIRMSNRVGLGLAQAEEIDTLNILEASLLAMRRALDDLGQPPPSLALVDGNRDPRLGIPTRLIVGGDGLSISIAAASIIAKVARDTIMVDLARDYPGYGFERHMGYGTKAHAEALSRLGICPAHRRSFKPIHKMLYEDN